MNNNKDNKYVQYRNKIIESLKIKKTLTDLELFDMMYDIKNERRLITVPSKFIKDLRKKGYSISQSRIFDINNQLDKIYDEIISEKLKPKDKKLLSETERKEKELKEQIKKLQDELNLSTDTIKKIKTV